MSLLLDRRPRSTRFLAWKIRIFTAAAVVAAVGIALDNPYVTGVALALLLVGTALRFLPEPRQSAGEPKPPEDGPTP
ncbi:MAG: hypothetical protein FJ207_12760 [Gemmatimonadetes bacterium]|nr:hypothetical protein [Gemmatimonadota bacterium]